MEEEGDPPGKIHCHAVGLLLDESEKLMQNFSQRKVEDALKFSGDKLVTTMEATEMHPLESTASTVYVPFCKTEIVCEFEFGMRLPLKNH